MPSSTIEYRNDVDPVFYTFAAQGSLHYGILMMWQGVEQMQVAKTTEDHAKADALLRHAKDYMRGATQMAELFCASWPESDDFNESATLSNKAMGSMAEVNSYREDLREQVVQFGLDFRQFQSQSNVHWMALMSNRSFNK